MTNPEPAGKAGPGRKKRVSVTPGQAGKADTPGDAPAVSTDAEFTEVAQAPRQVGVAQPVFEFFTSLTAVAEGLMKGGVANPMSRAMCAAQIKALSRELVQSVQRKSVPEVIRGTIGIAALCELLFLSVTPHYQEGGPPPDGEEAKETEAA